MKLVAIFVSQFLCYATRNEDYDGRLTGAKFRSYYIFYKYNKYS